MIAGGVGVGVGVAVGDAVGEGVVLAVGVGVCVGVIVGVVVAVGEAVAVAVGIAVGVGEGITVGVGELGSHRGVSQVAAPTGFPPLPCKSIHFALLQPMRKRLKLKVSFKIVEAGDMSKDLNAPLLAMYTENSL